MYTLVLEDGSRIEKADRERGQHYYADSLRSGPVTFFRNTDVVGTYFLNEYPDGSSKLVKIVDVIREFKQVSDSANI